MATSEYNRAYRLANLDRLKARRVERYAAHREEELAAQRADYAARREEKLAYHKQWRADHDSPPRRFGHNSNKLAKRHGIADRLDWRNLALGPCVYCGRDDETVSWDHVLPLSRGGANHSTNCARCCLDCNRSKQARTPEEWQDPVRAEAKRERKRAYIRQWHRDHYAELYAKRRVRHDATGHW